MKRTLLLILAALVVLPLTVFANAGAEKPATTGGTAAAASSSKYKESPMLAELVKQGKLPPVEERLPKNPLVFSKDYNDIESEVMQFEVGTYGGTARFATAGGEGGTDADFWAWTTEAILMTPGIDTMGQWAKGNLRGNWVESWSASSDSKVFTFKIREGLKWSDGVPVTTVDVDFRWNSDMLNKKINPNAPSWVHVNNVSSAPTGSLEVVDKYTFRIKFPEPYPLFPAYIGWKWNHSRDFVLPSHYMKQFHADFADKAELAAKVKAAGFKEDEWNKLYSAQRTYNSALGGTGGKLPTLQPWVFKSQPTQGVYVFERNPYYHKVDSAGQQLPYVDRVEVTWVADLQGQTLKTTAGEVDFVATRTNVSDFPLFKENEAKGGYKVVAQKMHVHANDIFLSWTYPDPVWQQVVHNVKFRQALSMAINRQHIIEAVQHGWGSLPTNLKVDFTYNPTKAKQLLDEIGLDKKDAEGWRLGPDGKRFVVPFEIAIWSVGMDKVVELVTEYWNAVGVQTTMKVIDSSLAGERVDANDIKAITDWTDWAVVWPLTPIAGSCTVNAITWDWCIPYANWWNSGGKDGMEPPEEVKKLFAGVDNVPKLGDAAARAKLMKETLQLFYDQIFWIPITESGYCVVTKLFGNFPEKSPYAISTAFSGEQMFFKK
jgi:peptide/nickel transport system substrate-binding protein